MPAQAGLSSLNHWIPACAGMTTSREQAAEEGGADTGFCLMEWLIGTASSRLLNIILHP